MPCCRTDKKSIALQEHPPVNKRLAVKVCAVVQKKRKPETEPLELLLNFTGQQSLIDPTRRRGACHGLNGVGSCYQASWLYTQQMYRAAAHAHTHTHPNSWIVGHWRTRRVQSRRVKKKQENWKIADVDGDVVVTAQLGWTYDFCVHNDAK